MNAYWFNVLTTLWLVAALPAASATKICYNSFGTLQCRNQMPVHARIGIWVALLVVLILVIAALVYWQRRRARRQRDAIASVEAGQINGPPPTPFESGFLPGRTPVSRPPPTYPFAHRTEAVPKSAKSARFIRFTPKTAIIPRGQERDSYSTASHYSTTPEDEKPLTALPPPAATRGFRGLGLPANPRPSGKYSNPVTPRDKNTRFALPASPRDNRERRGREWQVRLEALRSAPIRRGFEMLTTPQAPTHSKSAGVAGALTSKLRPLFAGTGRVH